MMTRMDSAASLMQRLVSCRNRIKQAEKMLAADFGANAGYVLARLDQIEIGLIASGYKTPMECIKQWGRLRHRIIKERLGL